MKVTSLSLLFLAIFAMTAVLCAGWVGGQGERCLCKGKILKRMKLKMVTHAEAFYPSASCPKTELLMTVKTGKKICLDPVGKQGKKILQGKIGKKRRSQRGKKQQKNIQ